jgi:hypothetical protein
MIWWKVFLTVEAVALGAAGACALAIYYGLLQWI